MKILFLSAFLFIGIITGSLYFEMKDMMYNKAITEVVMSLPIEALIHVETAHGI